MKMLSPQIAIWSVLIFGLALGGTALGVFCVIKAFTRKTRGWVIAGAASGVAMAVVMLLFGLSLVQAAKEGADVMGPLLGLTLFSGLVAAVLIIAYAVVNRGVGWIVAGVISALVLVGVSLGCFIMVAGSYGNERSLNKRIQRQPDDGAAYVQRAELYASIGETDKAIADFTQAIRCGLNTGYVHMRRGYLYDIQGEPEKAVADFKEAIRLEPKNAMAHNNLAWLMATEPKDSMRNGANAVRLATTACELSEWKDWVIIDTLAAAHAEAGDYNAAIKFQQIAIERGPEGLRRDEMQGRLALYRHQQPYREDPVLRDMPKPPRKAPVPAATNR